MGASTQSVLEDPFLASQAGYSAPASDSPYGGEDAAVI